MLRWKSSLLGITALLSMLAACNSDSADDLIVTVPQTSTAVQAFKLSADKKVMENLDSVFFSIDLNSGVIFNADSLPKGTDVSKIVPSITFAAEVSSATLQISGGSVMNDTITNYKENPGDTIDFTGRVVLNVTAADGVSNRSYRLKVNVHKEDPDSLIWDRLAVAALPSRLGRPSSQKTVTFKNQAVSLIKENDGSLTLSRSADLLGNEWDKNEIQPGFNPDIRSLVASSDVLYVLDADNHRLMSSADCGMTWTSTGRSWDAILGGYDKYVLGLYTTSDGVRYHGVYPATELIKETPAAADFPVKGWSNMVTSTTKWSQVPTAMIFGGILQDGSYTRATWGFDGDRWTVISVNTPPALSGATIVPYYVYRQTTTSWVQTEFSAWLLIGGSDASLAANRKVYICYDNGVNWREASSLLQLPEYLPGMTGLDNVVMTSPRSADISDSWSEKESAKVPAPRKIHYDINGYIISWDCPYIYLMGGCNPADNSLYDTIWRGVLARLTYTPLI